MPAADPAPSSPDAVAIVQIKVWLLEISPMVWRRMLVPSTCTLRELHGVIQIAMGWEGIHLFQFRLRSRRYGSKELSASSPDVALAALQLRKGALLRAASTTSSVTALRPPVITYLCHFCRKFRSEEQTFSI